MPTTLKLYFTLPTGKQEVRRVTLDVVTIEAIRTFLASKYGEYFHPEAMKPIRVEYVDGDGDRVLLSCASELEEGLRLHAQEGAGATWKLFCSFEDEMEQAISPMAIVSPPAAQQQGEEEVNTAEDEAITVDASEQPLLNEEEAKASSSCVTVEDEEESHTSDDEYERIEAEPTTPTKCATPTNAQVVDNAVEPESPESPATPSIVEPKQTVSTEEAAPTVVAEAAPAVEVTPAGEAAAVLDAKLESLIEERAPERFACRLCPKVFRAREFVRMHLQSKHPEVITDATETTETPKGDDIPTLTADVSLPVSTPPIMNEASPKSSPRPVEIADVTGHSEHVEPSPESESLPASVAASESEPTIESPTTSSEETATPSAVESSTKEVTHSGIICDGCGMSPIVGTRFHCTACVMPGGFDLCAACEAAGDRHPASHILLKMRLPASVPVGTAQRHLHCPRRYGGFAHMSNSAGPRPKALFVSDVTLADGLQVRAGETLQKVWSIKNVGEAAWPIGTRLVFAGGDLAPESDARTDAFGAAVPFAGPGDIVHVSIAIQVPNAVGRFRGTFRLEAPDRTRFGPRIWIDLVVPPEAEPTTEAATATEKKEEKPAVSAPAAVEEPPVVAPMSEEDQLAAAVAASLAIQTPVAVSTSASSVGATAPSKPAFEYSNQLAALRTMGFKDAELCRYLLLNNRGDVQAVVAWLLANSTR